MARGSKCKICEEEFGIGVHFGTSFLCMDCEGQFWDFIRAAIKALKSKKIKK